MHVLTNAEKLIPLRDAASLAESRRLAGMRMVTGTTSPSTRYERISVSPASCSIKSEYVIASHAFKPQYKCINYIPAWEQRKLGELGFAQSGIGFPDAEQGGAEGTPFFKVSDMNTPGNEYELAASKNYVTAEQIARMGWHPLNQVPAIFFAKVGAAVMLNRKRLVNEPFLLDNNTMAFSMDSSLLDTQFGQSLFERLDLTSLIQVGALPSFNSSDVESISVSLPSTMDEQRQIGQYLCNLNTLITLHQRKRESRIIRVRSFIWLAGDISGIGVSAYQPEKRRPYDRRQHQRRNVVLRLLRAMDQRIQGRCNS